VLATAAARPASEHPAAAVHDLTPADRR